MSAENKLKNPEYEGVAKRAAEEPSALIGALTDSGGEKQGGLTLTKEHILKIKHYSAYALTLPTTKEAAENWLGYTTISHPELQPSSMAALFSTIRAHASQWQPLVADNKTLAFQLKIAAGDILASGLPLIAKCEKLIGDDKELESWRNLTVPESGATTVALTEQQKKGFPIISRYIDHMQEVADKYITQVDEVVKKTQRFSGAFTELIKQVELKQKAVGDYQKEEKTKEIKAKIAELDKTIAALQKQYIDQVQDALKGAAGGIIGFIITGIFFGIQAEQTRKARNDYQMQRRDLSIELAKFHKIDGAVEELNTNLVVLVHRLQDADVSAKLLHTVWIGINTFLKDSKQKLEDIESVDELFLFSIYFRGFVTQWYSIQEKSELLTTIFDEAYKA